RAAGSNGAAVFGAAVQIAGRIHDQRCRRTDPVRTDEPVQYRFLASVIQLEYGPIIISIAAPVGGAVEVSRRVPDQCPYWVGPSRIDVATPGKCMHGIVAGFVYPE